MRKRQKDEVLLQRRWRVILVVLLGIGCMLSGCNSPLKFEKSQDEFGTTYRNEHIEIQIANNVENPEEIFKSIEQDLNTIHAFEPIENLTIIVNEKYLTTDDNGAIECNPRVVGKPEFTKILIAKSYNLYDNWLSEGLYGNLFSKRQQSYTTSVDYVSYYQKKTFSLFGARFFEGFASKEEIESLQQASTDLVKYLLNNGQKERLLKEEITIEDIKPWAEEKQIPLIYFDSVDEHIGQIKVRRASAFDQLYLETKRDINGFSIKIFEPNEEYDEAGELEQIIKRFDLDIARNLSLIKEKAPNFYKEYEKQLTQVPKIHYEFFLKRRSSFYNKFGGIVHLSYLSAQLHEYNHFLFQTSFDVNGVPVNKPMWVTEGIDPYLDFIYFESEKQDIKAKLYYNLYKNEHFRPIKKNDEDYRNYLNICREVLFKNFTTKELDAWERTISNKENYKKAFHFRNAMSIRFRQYHRLEEDGRINDAVDTTYDSRLDDPEKTPNKLSYFANRSFVAYLVEVYGYEKVLYLNVQDFSKFSFEEYFGKSYEELDADWKQYLIDNIKGGEFLVYGEKGKP